MIYHHRAVCLYTNCEPLNARIIGLLPGHNYQFVSQRLPLPDTLSDPCPPCNQLTSLPSKGVSPETENGAAEYTLRPSASSSKLLVFFHFHTKPQWPRSPFEWVLLIDETHGPLLSGNMAEDTQVNHGWTLKLSSHKIGIFA